MGERLAGPVCVVRSPKSRTIDSGTRKRVAHKPSRPTGTGLEVARTPKERAREIVRWFKSRRGKAAFPNANRRAVARGLLARIDKPWLISQRNSSLCGPTALIYGMAKREPDRYAMFVIDLFEHGRARLGKRRIRPSAECRNSKPKKVAAVDWIPLASLRDSMNVFLEVEGPENWLHEAASITTGSALAEWFTSAGYSDVKDEASTLAMFTQDKENLDKANHFVQQKYHVCLLLDPDVLGNKDTVYQRHWVVLDEKMAFSQEGLNTMVEFRIFSWGNKKTYSKALPYLLDNYYGFVACKY